MALNDVPASVTHILLTTGEPTLAYVGHSLGTDQMFVLQSMMPSIGQLIQPYIALAPVAFLTDMWSAARLGVPLEPLIRNLPFPVGLPSSFMEALGTYICNDNAFVGICADVLYSLNGVDKPNFNRTTVPVLIAHSAVTQSSWVYAQLAQQIKTGRYAMMDHGAEENLRRYNQTIPPAYNLGSITSTNIGIFRGLNDAFSDTPDNSHLLQSLNGK